MQRAREQEHGAGALQPYHRRDAVHQHRGQHEQQTHAEQHPEVPAGQRGQYPEKPLLDVGAALLDGGAEIFVLQGEQRQYQRKKDREQHSGKEDRTVQRQIDRFCPDDAHDVFGHSQLGDIIGGDENIRKGDENGAVKEDGPVLRKNGVADGEKAFPEQGTQLARLTPAGKVQPMQHEGELVQVPEGRQHRNERDAAQNAGGGEDLVRVVVGQVVHRRKAQRQRPDAPHGGQKEQVREDLVEDDGCYEERLGAVHQRFGVPAQLPVGRICLAQGDFGTAQ